jgi:hypothetical protein
MATARRPLLPLYSRCSQSPPFTNVIRIGIRVLVGAKEATGSLEVANLLDKTSFGVARW